MMLIILQTLFLCQFVIHSDSCSTSQSYWHFLNLLLVILFLIYEIFSHLRFWFLMLKYFGYSAPLIQKVNWSYIIVQRIFLGNLTLIQYIILQEESLVERNFEFLVPHHHLLELDTCLSLWEISRVNQMLHVLETPSTQVL